MDAISLREQAKYIEAFKGERYARKSGLNLYKSADLLEAVCRDFRPKSAIDFGCGNGAGALLLRDLGVERVQLVDIMPDSVLRPDVRELVRVGFATFQTASLWDPEIRLEKADLGVCTDVMEHIPREFVGPVIRNLGTYAQRCLFRIAMFGDKPATVAKYGGHIHHTVERPEFWRPEIEKVFDWVEDEEVQRNERLGREVYVCQAGFGPRRPARGRPLQEGG